MNQIKKQNSGVTISKQITDFIKKNFLSTQQTSVQPSYSNNNIQQISEKKIASFEKKIGYTFKNKNLLMNALIHPSTSKVNNLYFERLEFLGDRILNFTVAKMVFFEYPEMNESDMTPRLSHMICRERLFEVSQKIELSKYAAFKSYTQTKKIFADMIESIIGAIYIDDNNHYDNVTKFIHKYWHEMIDDELSNPRSELQELLHKHKLSNPHYEITQNDEIFQSKIIIKISDNADNHITAIGDGMSRKAANTDAAKKAVKAILSKGNL